MNRLSATSVVMRHMFGGAHGSRCRPNVAALPVAGMVKLNAAAVDEVSVTLWPAAGSGIFAGKLTRMMNTAGGGATDYDNGQKVVVKTPEDVGAVSVEKKDISTDSWESFQENLQKFPKWRSDKEIRSIYERWRNNYPEYSGGTFWNFKKNMRLIDEYNSKALGFKLNVDSNCEYSSDEVVRSLVHCFGRPPSKGEKLCEVIYTPSLEF